MLITIEIKAVLLSICFKLKTTKKAIHIERKGIKPSNIKKIVLFVSRSISLIPYFVNYLIKNVLLFFTIYLISSDMINLLPLKYSVNLILLLKIPFGVTLNTKPLCITYVNVSVSWYHSTPNCRYCLLVPCNFLYPVSVVVYILFSLFICQSLLIDTLIYINAKNIS